VPDTGESGDKTDRKAGPLGHRPALVLSQTAIEAAARRQDVEAAIVEALVAALLADFQRNPIVTDGPPRGTDRSPEAA
jgi:hypothetical protein